MQNPQYQQPLLPKKAGLSTPQNILIVILSSCLLCGLLGASGSIFQKEKAAEIQSNATTPATPLPEAKSPINSQPAPVAVSNISWNDYNSVFNLKSNSSDIQKDALWQQFENKTVAWQGTVYEFREGTFGGLYVNVKMDPETMTSDILLALKDDQKAKAINLIEGQKISFVGKLRNYGGAVLPLIMDEGEIK
jgi:hypothetical protein